MKGKFQQSHRFQAKPQFVDGIRFGSKSEAKRYSELKLLEKAGEIRNLELQPRYDIIINGIKCGFYKADFAYFTESRRVVEDVKGYSGDTDLYRFKKRIVEALYHIKITEITKANPAPWKTTLAHLAPAPNPTHFRIIPEDEVEAA